MQELKYPIGEFENPKQIDQDTVSDWIDTIEHFPEQLKYEIERMSSDQLNFTYRPGGWTVKQVVHHCVDSHMNSVIRFKLALTEHNPIIKTYEEGKWAELIDGIDYPVAQSLELLDSIHKRWVFLLRSLNEIQLALTYVHPDSRREIRLDEAISMYAWHCQHHLAHVRIVSQSA